LKSIVNVEFKKAHNSILFIGVDNDAIFPPEFTAKIANSYKDKNSLVDLKIFEGRSHFICGEKGLEEVAGYVFDWISKQ